jgi:hypothetical protein
MSDDLVKRLRGVPEKQTSLNERLGHHYLDVLDEGSRARDTGAVSPYHGHSLEHCLHASGWVSRDLRLALDAANRAIEDLNAERDVLIRDRDRWAEEAQVNTSPIVARLTADNARLRAELTKAADSLDWADAHLEDAGVVSANVRYGARDARAALTGKADT